MEDEELIFKRFAEDKQDQVRALVNYATLMGLSGKDLVSIGGKLDRIKASRERKQRTAIVQGYQIKPIGKDANKTKAEQARAVNRRFKLETATGAYYFEQHYTGWKVTNPRTKVSIRYNSGYYEWGRGVMYDVRERYNLLMDYHEGLLQLNF
jgi:hypothetical protein